MTPPNPNIPQAPRPHTRVIVDRAAFQHNITGIKQGCQPGTRLMAVIKADAYGHGAAAMAQTAVESGADFLGVARINEAHALRQDGIKAPILLFGPFFPDQAPWAAAHGIRLSVSSLETAQALSQAAKDLETPVKIHIKTDTGMGRMGLSTANLEETVKEILAMAQLPGLEVEGLYTHFANADEPDKTHTLGQFQTFMDLKQALSDQGLAPAICHCANSAATLELPQTHLDMVRPGISLYGLSHSPGQAPEDDNLKRVMSIESRIIHLKSVPKGFTVSYGSTWTAPRDTMIATVPIGYGDGYRRFNSNKGAMLVGGQRAPVVGRVCMDLTMLDVGHIPGLAVGDPVVIMGRQGEETLWAEELAALSHTVNYEVVASLTRRMPIHYTP